MRKTIIGLAFLSLLSLACCEETPGEVPTVPKNAVAGQITSAPCTYKTRKAEYPAQCGFIYVPENRTKPGSRLIALPYQRIVAQTKYPAEPLYALAGGPGLSNMSFDLPVSWFIRERDIVLVGYRGIDGTVRLDCPEVSAALKRGEALLDRPAINLLSEAFRQCAAQHVKAGVDLGGYTIIEVVDDVDAVRRALGYDRIDLNSISYGTRVALIYGWRYSQHVARSAMIGVNPPGRFRFDPPLLDGQLRRYAALCASDAHCAARTKDLAADIERALDNMPKRWLGFPVNRDAVLISTFMALFSTDGAAATFDMWIAAANGDYSGMALISAAYSMMLPKDMVWGEFASKGGADTASHTDFCWELIPGRYLIGSAMNLIGCATGGGWPMHEIPAEYRAVRPSGVETLMLSGSLDVSTPAQNAQNELLPLMKNARQITLTEFSHAGDLTNYQPEATHRLLATFYRTGQVDASGFRHRAVNFDPGWMSFPFIAKTLFATTILILGAVISLLIWAFRPKRRMS